jgi:mRNA interferase MazF
VTPSTTNYRPGDLVLVAFPYASEALAKRRPALVVLDTGDLDVVLARVTTQPHRTLHDVAIGDWRGAGLLAPSVVRTHKLATLEKALIRRLLGSLQAGDRQHVSAVLRQTYGAW